MTRLTRTNKTCELCGFEMAYGKLYDKHVEQCRTWSAPERAAYVRERMRKRKDLLTYRGKLKQARTEGPHPPATPASDAAAQALACDTPLSFVDLLPITPLTPFTDFELAASEVAPVPLITLEELEKPRADGQLKMLQDAHMAGQQLDIVLSMAASAGVFRQGVEERFAAWKAEIVEL